MSPRRCSKRPPLQGSPPSSSDAAAYEAHHHLLFLSCDHEPTRPTATYAAAVASSLATSPIHTAIDLISLTIAALLLLSLIFVLRLRLKNGRTSSHPLRKFNSLWTVCLLLFSFWVLTQFLRDLPFLHRCPHFSSAAATILTLPVQTCLCNFHLVLSLDLLELGFLITILYLVNASVRK